MILCTVNVYDSNGVPLASGDISGCEDVRQAAKMALTMMQKAGMDLTGAASIQVSMSAHIKFTPEMHHAYSVGLAKGPPH